MSFTNTFAHNLKYLLSNRNKRYKDLGKVLGFDSESSGKSTISSWVRGVSIPKLDVLIKISEFFEVSLDELCIYKIDDPYKQFEDFRRKNQNYVGSSRESIVQDSSESYKQISNQKLFAILQSALDSEESVAILTGFLTKNHQSLKDHPIYGMYVKQIKLEGENEKDELWLDVREKISESKLKQILDILNDKKVNG